MEKKCQTKTAPIYVTKPDVPELPALMQKLEEIWDLGHFTNSGPQLKKFENALCEKLRIPNCIAVNNGTLALQTALSCHNLKGEIITTPFSFVATAHAIKIAGLTPKFVDIDQQSLCIDPIKIERAITEKTSAILGVHVFGTPCAVEEIEAIAKRHNLKVIYDAAHCFNVEYKGRSILTYGDTSILSFHATKVFHTIEGGAVISVSDDIAKRAAQYINFGFDENMDALQIGTNGKMNEIQAAIGLLNLEHFNKAQQKRKTIHRFYTDKLNAIEGISLLPAHPNATSNYSYFPIIIQPSYPLSREELLQKFEHKNIHPRRYFHPLISDMKAYADHQEILPIASSVSEKIICLPLYSTLNSVDQQRITDIIGDNAT